VPGQNSVHIRVRWMHRKAEEEAASANGDENAAGAAGARDMQRICGSSGKGALSEDKRVKARVPEWAVVGVVVSKCGCQPRTTAAGEGTDVQLLGAAEVVGSPIARPAAERQQGRTGSSARTIRRIVRLASYRTSSQVGQPWLAHPRSLAGPPGARRGGRRRAGGALAELCSGTRRPAPLTSHRRRRRAGAGRACAPPAARGKPHPDKPSRPRSLRICPTTWPSRLAHLLAVPTIARALVIAGRGRRPTGR
jgi:hypothetical protein